MPALASCPGCSGQLRITDELVGREVRCPTCSHVFHAPGPAPDVPLEALDEVLPAPEEGLIGAIEDGRAAPAMPVLRVPPPVEVLPEVDAPRRDEGPRGRGRARAKEGEGRRRDQIGHRGGSIQLM